MNSSLTVRNDHQHALDVRPDLPCCLLMWRGWALYWEDCNCCLISGCNSKSGLCLLFWPSRRACGCFSSHPIILVNSSYVSVGLMPSFTQILALIFPPPFVSVSLFFLPILWFLTALWNTMHRTCLWETTTQYTIWSELLDHYGHSYMISLLCCCTLNFLFQKFVQSAEVLIGAGIFGRSYLTG